MVFLALASIKRLRDLRCCLFLAKASSERPKAPAFILALAFSLCLAPNLEPAIFKILYSGFKRSIYKIIYTYSAVLFLLI